MPYDKGDLVLISDGNTTSTCIVLTEMFSVSSGDDSFYYTYCLETGMYGVVYEDEIVSLVTAAFAPDFVFHSELFDNHYQYYSHLYEEFAYFPSFFPFEESEDSTEEDE
jgi:hypothetical protein